MPEERNWLTIAEAARRMGVSTQAVRARVKRGNLEHRRDNRNRLLVQVAGDEVPLPTHAGSSDATLREQIARLEERVANADALRERLEGEVAWLRAELERRRWPGLWPTLQRFWHGGPR